MNRSVPLLLLALTVPAAAQRAPGSIDGAALERIGARFGTVEQAMAADAVRGFAELHPDPALHRAVVSLHPGIVTVRHVGVGADVRAGDPLLALASPEALAARNDYLDARDEVALAREALRRDELLREDGLIADARLAATRAAATRAERRVRRLALALEAAGFDPAGLDVPVESGEGAPATLVLRAPLDGQVTRIVGDPGERIEAGAFVAEVVRFDRLVASIRLPAAEAARLSPGLAVTLDEGLGSGTVDAIARAVDPREQTVEVRATIDEPARRLAIGQRVGASIALSAAAELRRVPAAAVVSHAGQDGVFVMDAGRAAFVPIAGGAARGEWRLFEAGPPAGTRIVVVGTAALKAALAEGEDA